MNAIFVDILEKLMDNLSDKIDNSQNSLLIQQLVSKFDRIENSLSSQSDSINTLYQKISAIVSSHLDSLVNNMRDTIKSNNSDSEKNVIQQIINNNDLFLNKISSLTNNSQITSFIEKEINKMNSSVNSEFIRLNSSLENSDSSQILSSLTQLISSKYSEIDTSLKTRIDSLLSSSSSSNTSMYSELLSRLEKSSSVLDTVNNYFQKQSGSNSKGKQGEGKLELILSDIFPNASITNTSGLTASGDFFIEHVNKTKLLIDTKDYETVVPVKEVEKLIRDVEVNNCNGILISQNSGIAQKNDFEINIHDNNIIVFIHNAQYNPDKILLATNIIDHLEPLIVKNTSNSEESISSELLLSINREYQELASQKLNIINSIKKNQHELINQVQKLELPVLTKFLETKYANTGKACFKCELCNSFFGKNAKSLSAHQRKCKKENIVINTTTEISTESNSQINDNAHTSVNT